MSIRLRTLDLFAVLAVAVLLGAVAGHFGSRAAFLHARTMADRYADQRDTALGQLDSLRAQLQYATESAAAGGCLPRTTCTN